MYKYMIFFILIVFCGCSISSNSPSVSPINKDGEFLTIVNTVEYMYIPYPMAYDADNSVLECDLKGRCIKLKVKVDGIEN